LAIAAEDINAREEPHSRLSFSFEFPRFIAWQFTKVIETAEFEERIRKLEEATHK
jgi:hypothetical protein